MLIIKSYTSSWRGSIPHAVQRVWSIKINISGVADFCHSTNLMVGLQVQICSAKEHKGFISTKQIRVGGFWNSAKTKTVLLCFIMFLSVVWMFYDKITRLVLVLSYFSKFMLYFNLVWAIYRWLPVIGLTVVLSNCPTQLNPCMNKSHRKKSERIWKCSCMRPNVSTDGLQWPSTTHILRQASSIFKL